MKQSQKKKEIRSKKKGDMVEKEETVEREGKKHGQRWYEGSYYCTLLNETSGLFAQSM